ncbi:MAG TPA: PDZ domain-containing protein [Vicinamibacterales bacterium]|nr:PDZ domain-containing protein [Vicinamibacterales bacterium]
MSRAARLALALLALLLAAGAADARPWSWLGVRIRDLSEQEMDEIAARHGIREGFGVVIVDVMEGTPAAKAGMHNGDIVVAFNGRPVTETRLLQRLIAAAAPEQDVRLTVLRPDGRRLVPVRLTAMPRPVAGERVAAEFGFVLQDPESTGERARLAGPGAGLPVISFVQKGSAAERAGLEAGDVVVQVGDHPVLGREAAREALAEVLVERALRLTVRRGERLVPLEVPAPKTP